MLTKKLTFLLIPAIIATSTPILAGKDEVISGIRTLPVKTLTIGCNRKACPIFGANGIFMHGLHQQAAFALEDLHYQGNISAEKKRLIRNTITGLSQKHADMCQHDHPGVTLDFEAKSESSQGEHIQGDYFKIPLADRTYDAVFFEQFPPRGMISLHNNPRPEQMSDDFLPRAIEKARKALSDHGVMVIQLALDYRIHRGGIPKEKLDELRAFNPFQGWFGDYAEALHRKIQSGSYEGDDSLSKALTFYVTKMQQRIDQVVEDAQQYSGNMQGPISNFIKESCAPLLDLKKIIPEELNLSIPTRSTIPDTLAKLLIPFRQGDLMIQYMNTHGFCDAKLEWLEAGEHQFNKGAGWFLTARKDPTYKDMSGARLQPLITMLKNQPCYAAYFLIPLCGMSFWFWR